MVQTSEQLVSSNAERYLLIYMITVLVIVTGLVILFFIVFQKRKNKLLLDKYEQQRKFEKELVKVQSEIQEETLKNIGRELHDNVGQLLAFTSMQLNLVANMVSDAVKPKVDDTLNVVKDTIQEVRGLSRSLNNDIITNLGLTESIQNEIDRLNKLDKLKGQLAVKGEERVINTNDSIILFRIFQEFLSNSLKHADAKTLNVLLDYRDVSLELTVQDDGKGFDPDIVKKSSGLINMKNRAALIDADFSLITKPESGVKLVLVYPLESASQNT